MRKKPWKDYYQILGVKFESGQEEIKKAFRRLALECHPDRINGTKERFQEISEAYETLRDPEKRSLYDIEWKKKQLPKPKPIIKPSVISCLDLEPGKPIVKTFIVENLGGPFESISFKTSHKDYVRVINWQPDEKAIKIDVWIRLNDWDLTMEAYVIVKLDEETTYATIKAESKSEPTPDSEPKKSSYTPAPTPPNTTTTATKKIGFWGVIGKIVYIYVVTCLLIIALTFMWEIGKFIVSANKHRQAPQTTSRPIQNIKIAQPEIPIIPITPISDESFSPEVTRAKEIMGKNFIGPETVMKHFNIPLDKNGVEAFKRIPFSEETLITHKDDCILVADFGISLALLEKIFAAEKNPLFKIGEDSYYNPTFKDWDLTRETQWRLIHKNLLSNPSHRNYYEQLNSLPEELYVPKTASIAYTVLLYYLKNNKYLFFNEIPDSNTGVIKEISGSDIGSLDNKNRNNNNGHGVVDYYEGLIGVGAKYNNYNDYYGDTYYSPEFDGDPSKTRLIYLVVALKPEK